MTGPPHWRFVADGGKLAGAGAIGHRCGVGAGQRPCGYVMVPVQGDGARREIVRDLRLVNFPCLRPGIRTAGAFRPMDPDLFARLSAQAPLGIRNTPSREMRCKICDGDSVEFDLVDLNKACSTQDFYAFGFSGVMVPYLKCASCGFVFTKFFDDWSAADFSRFIYNDDYIKVDPEYLSIRPERMANEWANRLGECRSARILDYGSGTGVFASRMRSFGFQVEGFDPFSSPGRPNGKFDIITCFEVLEHASDPKAALSDMKSFLEPAGCIILTTGIQPDDIMERRCNWWYIGPRNGHISIFSQDSLAFLAKATGFILLTEPGALAFVPRVPSPVVSSALSGAGSWLHRLELGAPPQGSANAGLAWNGVETEAGIRFRWTKVRQVEWQIPSDMGGARRMEVVIPFLMEVEPGFAARCTLSDGYSESPVIIRHGKIFGGIDLQNAPVTKVILTMPTPKRPSDIGGSQDHRRLGLAIRCKGCAGEAETSKSL